MHTTEEITLEGLRAGRSTAACSEYIHRIDEIFLSSMLQKLLYERLKRKNDDIVRIFQSSHNDWHQTLHTLLFRVIGGTSNREAFEELSRRVTYQMIARESSSLPNIEALLLGGSGLLELYPSDEHVMRLKQEFSHLRVKYDIEPMSLKAWRLTNIYLHNHPTLRIAQIAACMYQNTITMESIVACQRRRDVYRLFSGRASQYWIEHFTPHNINTPITRRIGQFKSDLLGINFVVQLQYAYGSYMQSDGIMSRALLLLQDIPSEDNRYIRMWDSHKRVTRCAYDSQAMLQLSLEYCLKDRCEECPLAKRLLKSCSQH